MVIDKTGNRYGKLVVVGRGTRKTYWSCTCDCGKTTEVAGSSLVRGFTNSCGCIRSSFVSLVGNTYGRLTVVTHVGKAKDRHPLWECVCECGATVVVEGKSLKSGNTKSCGCLKVEAIQLTTKNRVVKYTQFKSAVESMVGKQYGDLVVIGDALKYTHSGKVWVCKCSCGRTRKVSERLLDTKEVTSCGKLHVSEGETFGRLKVLSLDRTTATCVCSCGVIKDIYIVSLTSGNTKSCGCLKSEVCRETIKAVSGRRGALSPRYNHNLTDIDRQLKRSYAEYPIWRTSIFERDSFICQCCGQIGGSLNAHHLEDYSNNIELRLELSNGTTLCARCHNDFHKLYGKSKGNSTWQFLEFINTSLSPC